MKRLVTWQGILGAVLALVVAGNVGFYTLVVQPLSERQREHVQRLLALQGQLHGLKTRTNALKAQIKTLKEVEEYRRKFPERNSVVRVSGELKQVAETLSLKLPSITYQPETVKDVDLFRVRLTLSVEGAYNQVRHFLHELENRRQYLVVEQMGLSDRGQGPANQVGMNLSLAGYFR